MTSWGRVSDGLDRLHKEEEPGEALLDANWIHPHLQGADG